MADELVSALLQDVNLRVVYATTTALSRKASELHECLPTAGAMLAMGLTSGALLASLQKERTRVNLQLACDGPLRGLFADAHQDGAVRGYVNNPYVRYTGTEGRWKWRPALGNAGYVSVLRDLGGGEHYRSHVELQQFDLAEDLQRYFEISEQLPTRVHLEVLPEGEQPLGRVAGLLLQPLPGGDKDALERLHRQLSDAGPQGFRGALERAAAAGEGGEAGPIAFLEALFPGHPVDPMSRYPLRFECTCSRERVKQALLAMGRAELEDVIEKDRKAEATCHFCSTKYVIPEEELRSLLAEATA
jgi:molecular chaperone Hsp33